MPDECTIQQNSQKVSPTTEECSHNRGDPQTITQEITRTFQS